MTAPTSTAVTLIERTQQGDRAAFGEIYEQYRDAVMAYTVRRVGSRHLAEDITSETFTRALARIHTFTWRGRDPGAWLITIARNLIADHYKSAAHQRTVYAGDASFTDDQPGTADTAGTVLNYLTALALWGAVVRLTTMQRQCIELRYARGLSVAETAAAMGRNQTAVKALTYRATQTLSRVEQVTS